MTSGKVKPWQIVLFLAAAAALGWSAWNVLKSGTSVPVSGELTLVDVRTGQLYVVDTSRRGVVLPERHPETGEEVLFAASQDETSGVWQLGRGSEEMLRLLDGELAAVVDASTGELKVLESPAKRLRRK